MTGSPARVDVWPVNADAVRLFLACATQWRYAPMSGERLGLDYGGVRAAAAMMRIRPSPDLFGRLREMEREALTALGDSRTGR